MVNVVKCVPDSTDSHHRREICFVKFVRIYIFHNVWITLTLNCNSVVNDTDHGKDFVQ